MNIVLINHSDSRGGASVVAYRLMKALRALGHDASMLVVHKATDDPDVHVAASGLRAKLPFLKEHLRIFKACNFSRKNIFKISIASDGLPLAHHPLVKSADAVILNWVNQGMLSLDEIALMAKERRVVWTMHDMWNLTSLCHHAGNCTQYVQTCSDCPLVCDKSLGERTWQRKKRMYDSVPLSFVAVSSWLAEKCRRSSLFTHFEPAVIPNAFPVDKFYIEPRKTRQELNLPADKKIILMGAARLDDPVKGLPYAVDALNRLKRTDAVAVFYGAIRDASALAPLKFPHVCMGAVDNSLVAELCAHASVVMSSSLYETLPGTIIEGMAGGATPVAFDSGGQRDIIRKVSEGYLVQPYDISAFADAIDGALDGPCQREVQHRLVAERFSSESVAGAYLELLKNL